MQSSRQSGEGNRTECLVRPMRAAGWIIMSDFYACCCARKRFFGGWKSKKGTGSVQSCLLINDRQSLSMVVEKHRPKKSHALVGLGGLALD